MSEKIADALTSAYDTFVLRDLTKAAAGGLAISALALAFSVKFDAALATVTSSFLAFALFLTVSYFLGLLMEEAGFLLGLFRTEPKLPDAVASRYVAMASIRKSYDLRVVHELERTVFLKHVGSSIGAASLISAVTISVAIIWHPGHQASSYLYLLVAYILFFVTCLFLNRRKLDEQSSAIAALLANKEPIGKQETA